MKILHIIDSGGLYGAEVMLLNLVDEQVKLGLGPTICSIGKHNDKEKPLETEALKRGFKVKKFGMRAGPNVFGAWKILKFAHQENFDLIHAHGYKGNILFGFIPKRLRKIPLVSTLHGWTSTSGFTKMKLYEWLDTKSLKFIDAVVFVHKAMLSNPRINKYSTDDFFIINNGIPINEYGDNNCVLDSEIAAFCQDGFVVGSIGRLSEEKGFDYLIEAVNLLSEKIDNLKLIIIGDGTQREHLYKKTVTLKLADRVFLPGYRDCGSQYLPFFRLFALPSLTEGMPITILEAMRAKIPIVATKVGGVPEVLQNGKGGVLVEPRDPKSLADAILRIRNNRKFAEQLISFSHNEVLTKYTSKTMALKYLGIYRNVINFDMPANKQGTATCHWTKYLD